MSREMLTISGMLLGCLFITNSVFAEKVDNTVLYNSNNKAYCNKPLQLNYSPGKDMYFCTHNPRNNYIYVDGKGKPYCIKPYELVYGTKPSRIFKREPSCVRKQGLKKMQLN